MDALSAMPSTRTGARSFAHYAPLFLALARCAPEDRAPARPVAPPAAATGWHVLSRDPLGAPRVIRPLAAVPAAPGTSPADAARAHLAQALPALGADPRALGELHLVGVHASRSGSVATFQRVVDGVEVYPGRVRVLMGADRRLVAINAGAMQAPGRAGARFLSEPGAALARALGERFGLRIDAARVRATGRSAGGYRWFGLEPGAEIELSESRVKPVLWDGGAGGLVLAHFVEFFARRAGDAGSDAWRYVIADDDGRVLERASLRADGQFNYRAYVDPADLRPRDTPTADYSPHPTGYPDGTYPPFVPPDLVGADGFNTNPAGGSDPWLPAGATETQGNNVNAYSDQNDPDGLTTGDFRANITSPDTFDRTYDPTIDALSSRDQAMAAITQLFYVTNWLHDWYYDSGFDEAAGNAQASNFGRGGVEGDALRAEAQDGALSGSRNNSNMTVPADGMSPRMQMYLWTWAHASLQVQPQNLDVTVNPADFGPTNATATAALVQVDDGAGVVTDGCTAPTNSLAGRVVLIDRGNCTFKLKAVNAQSAGAVGVIIADNMAAATPPMLGDGAPATAVSIPVVSVTQADGAALAAAIAAGTPTAAMSLRRLDRDGSLDIGVSAHEWGHYLHLRLTACGNAQCGAMSEGWADFVALHTIVRAGDNLDGAFPLATYAVSTGDPAYFGIRRVPYSTDFARDPLTFRHITDGEPLPTTAPMQSTNGGNSEPHNAGEVWASMLFESYVAMLRAHPYAEARRRMSDYVVAGMMMTPANPTYTEARDGLLAAAAARDANDVVLLGQAFARRGAGVCGAVSPERYSQDFTGVVESFTSGGMLQLGAPTIDDSVQSCDQDGLLDGGETGVVSVPVSNVGTEGLAAITVNFSSTNPAVSFPDGASVTLNGLAIYTGATASVRVRLDPSVSGLQSVDITANATGGGGCARTASAGVAALGNADEVPNASATDDVESRHTLWTPEGDGAAQIWSRAPGAGTQHVWRGHDFEQPSSTALVSPPLPVSATQPFVLHFAHRYAFEFSQNMAFDGGVIELSTNGTTWVDASTLATVSYPVTIATSSGNPLAGRPAFGGQNAAWPAQDTVRIDFGTALAGQTVRVRFRIGTDQAVGASGWELDDIGFDGIDATPFDAIVPESTACGTVPDAGVADASRVDARAPDANPVDAARVESGLADVADAHGGDAVAGDGGSAAPQGGCGCRAAPPNSPRAPIALALAIASLTVLARRRRSS